LKIPQPVCDKKLSHFAAGGAYATPETISDHRARIGMKNPGRSSLADTRVIDFR
jgi:hypothetical protein